MPPSFLWQPRTFRTRNSQAGFGRALGVSTGRSPFEFEARKCGGRGGAVQNCSRDRGTESRDLGDFSADGIALFWMA